MISANSLVSSRLFFALWPSNEMRALIDSRRKLLVAHAGKSVPSQNIHITLLFLGNVSAMQKACLLAAANQLECGPFSLQIDGYGYWSRSKLVWLGPSGIPSAMMVLIRALQAVARGCGIELTDRPYKPHISLVRHCGVMPGLPPIEPFCWQQTRFVLVDSENRSAGVHYKVIKRWSLK